MSDGLDVKIAEYYKIKPLRFPVLKSLTLTQSVDRSADEMQQQLSIILAKDERFDGEMLYLNLIGVRNLRFEQPTLSLISWSHVEIAKAPSPGTFDRRYVVLDAEDGTLACSCHDFTVAIQ